MGAFLYDGESRREEEEVDTLGSGSRQRSWGRMGEEGEGESSGCCRRHKRKERGHLYMEKSVRVRRDYT